MTRLFMEFIERQNTNERSQLPSMMRFALGAILTLEVVSAQSLKIATINTWSGLDYHGIWAMGEYESPETRQKRFNILLTELRNLQPDVIALQELNPVGGVSSNLADSLGYDAVYQRVNGGIKVGPVGLPWNLNEGLAILARKHLRLELVDVWPLSGSFGAFGNGLSFHFREENIALVGKIQLDQARVFVINTHFPANLRADSIVLEKMKLIAGSESQKSNEIIALIEASDRRLHQAKLLSDYISSRLGDNPVILVGDFNATAMEAEIRYLTGEKKFSDVMALFDQAGQCTWDPEQNTNIRFSLKPFDARGEKLSDLELLDAWYDGFPRRIDYIFLNPGFTKEDVKSVQPFLEKPHDSLFASDHYGVIAEIDCSRLNASAGEKRSDLSSVQPTFEPLPILSYDTDVGFGYGAKAFFLNQLGLAESFDAVLFNSTKGERWYRLVFSLPDFELRQGKTYSLAFDLLIDYDKWITNSFFGIGNQSKCKDREMYTREPLEVTATFSRGFSEQSVGQASLRFKAVRNYNFDTTSTLMNLAPTLN
ncbi:MAG TPA: endonuclease/exonuclease/phosphatase family protein, partial [Bacteroidota bacterium]|nr:endonuclease/exonuclease/phosphatase family protein [Bacteroidota bacterium]